MTSCSPEATLNQARLNQLVSILEQRLNLTIEEARPYELIEWEGTNLVAQLEMPILVNPKETAFVRAKTYWLLGDQALASKWFVKSTNYFNKIRPELIILGITNYSTGELARMFNNRAKVREQNGH